MKKLIKQYLLYCIFATISIILNVLIQIVMEFILKGINFLNYNIYKNITYLSIIKILIATLICFNFKFIIDKNIIFNDKTRKIDKNMIKFLIYTSFSIITTITFWGTELLFKILFHTQLFEMIGAVIGLTIGYTFKFFLDKKFVFSRENNTLV
ncbi:MAG TPA: GtrA family protein [Spirochaetota bacterium]|nr:GtrA family protein [Spirochaetota bacterium]HPP05454.1 GtrA family protein [Spirochaetota bacterium]